MKRVTKGEPRKGLSDSPVLMRSSTEKHFKANSIFQTRLPIKIDKKEKSDNFLHS